MTSSVEVEVSSNDSRATENMGVFHHAEDVSLNSDKLGRLVARLHAVKAVS